MSDEPESEADKIIREEARRELWNQIMGLRDQRPPQDRLNIPLTGDHPFDETSRFPDDRRDTRATRSSIDRMAESYSQALEYTQDRILQGTVPETNTRSLDAHGNPMENTLQERLTQLRNAEAQERIRASTRSPDQAGTQLAEMTTPESGVSSESQETPSPPQQQDHPDDTAQLRLRSALADEEIMRDYHMRNTAARRNRRAGIRRSQEMIREERRDYRASDRALQDEQEDLMLDRHEAAMAAYALQNELDDAATAKAHEDRLLSEHPLRAMQRRRRGGLRGQEPGFFTPPPTTIGAPTPFPGARRGTTIPASSSGPYGHVGAQHMHSRAREALAAGADIGDLSTERDSSPGSSPGSSTQSELSPILIPSSTTAAQDALDTADELEREEVRRLEHQKRQEDRDRR